LPRVYLNVSYAEKDGAKALGAKWDPGQKKWYAPSEEIIFENRGLWKWVPRDAADALKSLQDAKDEAQAEKNKEKAILDAWKNRAPRFNTAQELLDMHGIDRSTIKRRDGFCGMCDSTMRKSWSLSDGYHFFHHVRYDPREPEKYYNQKEYDIIIAEIEDELKFPPDLLYPKFSPSSDAPADSAHRKLTVTQICKLERCEQQMVYDSERGEKRSKAWVQKGKAGTKVHKRYEMQVAAGQKPKGSPCFIATACFGPESREVYLLRQFRDLRLRRSKLGRASIALYYKLSPPIANVLSKRVFARRAVRAGLKVILSLLKQFGRIG